MKKLPFALFLLLTFLLVACGGSNNATEPMAENTALSENDAMMNNAAMADEAMNDEALADEAMHDETMADEAMDEAMSDEAMGDEMMSDAAAWQKIALTNVRTGETFTLADFAGKTVFVEPMATWCTNCRRQLTNVSSARAQFGEDVVLSVSASKPPSPTTTSKRTPTAPALTGCLPSLPRNCSRSWWPSTVKPLPTHPLPPTSSSAPTVPPPIWSRASKGLRKLSPKFRTRKGKRVSRLSSAWHRAEKPGQSRCYCSMPGTYHAHTYD